MSLSCSKKNFTATRDRDKKVMKMFWSLDFINWNHEVHLVASKKGIKSCNFHSLDEGFCDEADERNSKEKEAGKKTCCREE